MTILFKGNNFKYEIEAVIKLFFPGLCFDFLYDVEIPAEGDVFAAVCENGGLYVLARVGTLTAERSGDDTDDEKAREFLLCTMLFECLEQITGITPPWGTLTGIRPVKRVNKLLDEGASKEECFKLLKEKYHVSDEKCELAYLTAVTQKPFFELPQRSFSLYVSIPFCPTRCSYCSFVSHSLESAKLLIPQYIDKLCDEIKLTAQIADELGLKLDTIYFGGGTPTSLESDQLARIMSAVAESFNISRVREYTVEAGRPDTVTKEKLIAIKENGAGRISVNPQTLNDDVLKAIGRKHTVKQFYDAFALAREVGFKCVNTDVIAGLPGDTAESFKNTINGLIALNPENITVHTLCLKRSSALFWDEKQLEEVKKNPSAEMVAYSAKHLIESGYAPYYLYRQKNTIGNQENAGYSKAGFESLYNIYIMEEMQTILAVGAGGSTKLADYSTGKIERICNYKYPYEYINRFDKMTEKKKGIAEFYKER